MMLHTAEKLANEELVNGNLTRHQESLMRFIIHGVRDIKAKPETIRQAFDEFGGEYNECPTCGHFIDENRNQTCTCGQMLLQRKEKK